MITIFGIAYISVTVYNIIESPRSPWLIILMPLFALLTLSALILQGAHISLIYTWTFILTLASISTFLKLNNNS